MKKNMMKHLRLNVVIMAVMLMTVGCGSTEDTNRKDIENTVNETVEGTTSDNDVQEEVNEEEINQATEEETQASDTTQDTDEVTIKEQVIYDQNDVVITAVEMVEDSFMGEGMKLRIENNTDKNLGISCNAVIVNNYMIDDLFVASVAAGKKANETLYFSETELEEAGITSIGQIEIDFDVYDGDSYDSLFDTGIVTIQTSAYETMVITAMDEGVELFNEDGIRIVGIHVEEDTFWGAEILLFMENKSGRNVSISVDDMSINGYMISPLFVSTVYDEKMMIDDITLMSSDLEENDIDSIDDIELQFHIYDADTYETILDSEPIQFQAK